MQKEEKSGLLRLKIEVWLRNLSDSLSEIRERPFLIVLSMITGLRTYVYKPLEVAFAAPSRLHVQAPEVTRADSGVCKNGWKKKKISKRRSL